MTPQEIFDKAYLGVIKQGRKSSNNGSCKYRGPDNTACGVGHLVDDILAEKMDTEFENMCGTSIDEIISLAKSNDLEYEIPYWMIENTYLLIRIQKAHDAPADDEFFITEFRFNMRNVAEDFQLTIPQLETS